MSILISTGSPITGNGYLHLTSHEENKDNLSGGRVDSTVIHTAENNLFEAITVTACPLSGGHILNIDNQYFTGDYCKVAMGVPGLTVEVGNGIMRYTSTAGGPIVFDVFQLSLAYLYDPISNLGCSCTGAALGVYGPGLDHFITGNYLSCGFGTAQDWYSAYGSNAVPVVTFNLSNANASTMWNNRDSLILVLYITNGILDVANNDFTISPVHTGYDVVVGSHDIKINDISIFDRKFITSGNAYTGASNCVLNEASDITKRFCIYNVGQNGYTKPSITSVRIDNNYIAAFNESTQIQRYGFLFKLAGIGITVNSYLHYSRIVKLSVGQGYTLPIGGSCIAMANMSISGGNVPGITASKFSTSTPDGSYYVFQFHLIVAGGSPYSQLTYLSKSGSTLTFNSNVSNLVCWLIVYDK